MTNITKFPQPPEAPISITLTGAEWFAIALKLASGFTTEASMDAEAKMLAQLKTGGR